MSTTENTPEPALTDEPETAAVDEAAEASPDAAVDLQTQLDEAQAQAQNHWDALLRLRAEMENLRKRNTREVEKARRFGIERFATDLLLVADSLEQGLAAATTEPTVDQLIEGMKLTLKMLGKVMTDHGIQVIDPEGEAFDPELHEAMSMIPATEGQPANTVLNVVQRGYLLNERLIRPARVIVAKGD